MFGTVDFRIFCFFWVFRKGTGLCLSHQGKNVIWGVWSLGCWEQCCDPKGRKPREFRKSGIMRCFITTIPPSTKGIYFCRSQIKENQMHWTCATDAVKWRYLRASGSQCKWQGDSNCFNCHGTDATLVLRHGTCHTDSSPQSALNYIYISM